MKPLAFLLIAFFCVSIARAENVKRDKGIAPFFLLYVADHVDTTAQAQRLDTALKEAGIKTTLYGAKDTNHTKINENIGVADDPATKALFEFVGESLKK